MRQASPAFRTVRAGLAQGGGRAGRLLLLLCLGVGLAFAWPWSKDMVWTPVLAPFEEAMGTPPPGTVPVQGGELRPRPAELANPFAPTPENLQKGRELFLIYCAVCHGRNAEGGGTVGEKFLVAPFKLTDLRPEDYMYQRVRDGGAFMPSYREALSPEEAWLVVTYVRSLQK